MLLRYYFELITSIESDQLIVLGIPLSVAHEANFEYLLKKTLDEIIQETPNYQGLVTELEPNISEMGRADLLVKDGLKPLIIFETKKNRSRCGFITSPSENKGICR